MAVARVTEIVASSNKSFVDAIDNGFSRASKTVRGITGLEVGRMTAKVENNKMTEFRVHLSLTFILEG